MYAVILLKGYAIPLRMCDIPHGLFPLYSMTKTLDWKVKKRDEKSTIVLLREEVFPLIQETANSQKREGWPSEKVGLGEGS